MRSPAALRLLLVFTAALPLRAFAQDEAAAAPAPEAADAPAAVEPAAAPGPETSTPSPESAQQEQGEQAPPPPSSEAQPAARPPPSTAAETPASTATETPPAPTGIETPAEREEQDEVLPWMASLTWDQTYAVTGFARDAQPSFNPTYEWAFVVDGGYRLDPLTTLYARQDFLVELTDSDATTTRQELQLTDTILEAWRTFVEAHPGGEQQKLVFSGRAGVELPVSLTSQAAGFILGTRAQLRLAYLFEDVLRGLNTKASLRYSHRWGGNDTVQAEEAYPCRLASFDGATSCSQLGRSVVRNVVVFSTDAELMFARDWGVGALLWLEWILTAGQPGGTIDIETGPVAYDGADSASRNRRILDFWVRYQFDEWFSARAHLLNAFQEIGPDGRYRDPFDAQDMLLGLELSVSFDALIESTHGHAGDR